MKGVNGCNIFGGVCIVNARRFCDEAKKESAQSNKESHVKSSNIFGEKKTQELNVDTLSQSEGDETLIKELSEFCKAVSKSEDTTSRDEDNLLTNSESEKLDSESNKTRPLKDE